MTLCNHMDRRCLSIQLDAKTREEALHALALRAESEGLVDDHEDFFEKLKIREEEMSTGVGRGIAVPHAEVPDAVDTFVIGATLVSPVEYQALDDMPVDIIFLIGGKPGKTGLHLQILSRIARLARQPEFLHRLRLQRDPEAFWNTIEEEENRLYSEEEITRG